VAESHPARADPYQGSFKLPSLEGEPQATTGDHWERSLRGVASLSLSPFGSYWGLPPSGILWVRGSPPSPRDHSLWEGVIEQTLRHEVPHLDPQSADRSTDWKVIGS